MRLLPGGSKAWVNLEMRTETEAKSSRLERRFPVTAIHQVLEEGRMVRRVRCYDFSWTPRYGWFYKEIRTSRSGEEVWIWSETEGESVVQ